MEFIMSVTIKAISYKNDRSEILFYSIEGQGHVWPGGRAMLPESIVGKDTGALQANEVIWDFFSRHPQKAAAGK